MQTRSRLFDIALGPTGKQGYLRLLALSVLCWSGVMFLEATEVYGSDASLHWSMPWSHYVIWPVFNWFVMALLTPLIFRLGERYPVTGARWITNFIYPHAVACLGCLMAQGVARGIAGFFYTLHHETRASVFSLFAEWMVMRAGVAVIAYVAIVLVAGLAERRQREVHAAHVEASVASADLERLRIQLQPHFLFNTLQAAITLVQQDPEAAEDVLLRLSQLLRVALDELEANEIPLSRELEILDLYVGIQKRRFGERLAVDVHADPDVLGLSVPPLILQPLVENAIHHGIGKHKGEDRIEVFARQHEGDLQIEVWNRNSIVEDAKRPPDGRGVGLRNTRARLEHSYGPGSSLLFRPLAAGGAVAIIVIPLSASGRLRANAPVAAAV